MEDLLLSGEELDELLRQVCCGGECKANDDPDEQGICCRSGYLPAAETVVVRSMSDADAMLARCLASYGAAKP
jgi:hypothetical protein